jgi:hypothetical protein
VVGYLAAGLPEGSAPFLPLFHAGLKETGYTDGRNVAMEYIDGRQAATNG